MIDQFSFDINDDEVSLDTINGEAPVMEAEIVSDPEKLNELSLSVQKKNKETLQRLKSKVMLSLDQRKLKEAQKIISGLENIGDMFSDEEIIERVRENTSTAQDMKFLAEAYSKLLDSQRNLMRLDSVDGQGTAAKLKLAVQFENGQGNKVQTVIETEG